MQIMITGVAKSNGFIEKAVKFFHDICGITLLPEGDRIDAPVLVALKIVPVIQCGIRQRNSLQALINGFEKGFEGRCRLFTERETAVVIKKFFSRDILILQPLAVGVVPGTFKGGRGKLSAVVDTFDLVTVK